MPVIPKCLGDGFESRPDRLKNTLPNILGDSRSINFRDGFVFLHGFILSLYLIHSITLTFFMKHFVYILYSELHDKYYKGYSTDPYKRLGQHNAGKSRYTRSFLPWELVYIELLPNKTDALKREKSLKKYSKNQIEELMLSLKNILR